MSISYGSPTLPHELDLEFSSVPGKVKGPVLGKTPLSKKAQEKTYVHRARFNGGPNCQAGQGKGGAAPSLGKQWLL
jgi:hypothetical protein